jgi:hypothetical protein
MDLTSFIKTAELEDRGPAGIIVQEFRPLRAPSGRVREFDCASGGVQLPLAPKDAHLRDAYKQYQNEMTIIKTWSWMSQIYEKENCVSRNKIPKILPSIREISQV